VKTNVNLLLLFQSATFHQGQKEHSRKTKTIHLLKRRQIQEHSGIPKSLGVKMHRPVFLSIHLKLLELWFLIYRKLEKEMATHSSILAWRSPWTEEPGRLQFA